MKQWIQDNQVQISLLRLISQVITPKLLLYYIRSITIIKIESTQNSRYYYRKLDQGLVLYKQAQTEHLEGLHSRNGVKTKETNKREKNSKLIVYVDYRDQSGILTFNHASLNTCLDRFSLQVLKRYCFQGYPACG